MRLESEMRVVARILSLEGYKVLKPDVNGKAMPLTDSTKHMLDRMHLAKITRSDSVAVVTGQKELKYSEYAGSYYSTLGESTSREVDHALRRNVPVTVYNFSNGLTTAPTSHTLIERVRADTKWINYGEGYWLSPAHPLLCQPGYQFADYVSGIDTPPVDSPPSNNCDDQGHTPFVIVGDVIISDGELWRVHQVIHHGPSIVPEVRGQRVHGPITHIPNSVRKINSSDDKGKIMTGDVVLSAGELWHVDEVWNTYPSNVANGGRPTVYGRRLVGRIELVSLADTTI